MKNVPDIIYLQVRDENGEVLDDVTWCKDRICDTDIEYTRSNVPPCSGCQDYELCEVNL